MSARVATDRWTSSSNRTRSTCSVNWIGIDDQLSRTTYSWSRQSMSDDEQLRYLLLLLYLSELDHPSTDGGETTNHVEIRPRNDWTSRDVREPSETLSRRNAEWTRTTNWTLPTAIQWWTDTSENNLTVSRTSERDNERRESSHNLMIVAYLQELHQQFEQEKGELRTQWLEEVNRSQSEHQHINQQYRELKDNYTKQVKPLSFVLSMDSTMVSI